MNTRTPSSRRMLQIALMALVLRALVPMGMMAAPVSDGWLFQLCPSGMSMPSYMALLGHDVGGHGAHADHADHEEGDGDFVCGLSAGFSAIAVEPEVLEASGAAPTLALMHTHSAILPRAPPTSNRTRAPPDIS